MTNPSTMQARAIVDALLRCGIDEVALAPGSRNGPLSIALAQAAAQNRIRLHVRLDERSASFLALGIARVTGTCVAVLCTSGTAAAHFHAVAFEATEAGVPLLLLTADRPAEVRGMGANQTIDQREMFGPAVLKSFDAPLATTQPASQWRTLISDAVAVAMGNATVQPGAVHVNLPFAEPLVPGDGDVTWTAGLPDVVQRPRIEVPRASWSKVWPAGGATPRGIVITSDPAQDADVLTFARALQWPVLAEPGSGCRVHDVAIVDYMHRVGDSALTPDLVMTVGRFALSRPVAALVKSAKRHVAVGRAHCDPFQTADLQIPRLPDVSKLQATDAAWLAAWRTPSARDAETLSSSHQWVAQALTAVQQGDIVWYGPSSTIRYAERVAPAFDDVVISRMNRGTNGIDGVVSSAIGASLAQSRRVPEAHGLAIMGDLTFLHDINGLLIEPGSPVPNLSIVVLDSNGGRIFKTLEQGAPEYADVFERVYATPHNRDLVAIARGYDVRAVRVATHDALDGELAQARREGGITVIVVDDRG